MAVLTMNNAMLLFVGHLTDSHMIQIPPSTVARNMAFPVDEVCCIPPHPHTYIYMHALRHDMKGLH